MIFLYLFMLKNIKGFTLVEVMVVFSITAFVAVLVGRNLSRNQIDFQKIYGSVMSDVRRAQSLASASARYNNVFRCGYGVHYENQTVYSLYAGPDASIADCDTDNSRFGLGNPGETRISGYSFKSIPDPGAEFKSSFPDIFFKPPDPKTFINDSNILGSGSGTVAGITIGRIGVVCPTSCKTICVYSSGSIELREGTAGNC